MTAYDDPWLSDDEKQLFNKALDDQRRLMERQLIESFRIPYVTQPEPTKEKLMNTMFEMTIEKNEELNGWYSLQRYMAAPEYDFVVLEPTTATFALDPAMFPEDTVLAIDIDEATLSGWSNVFRGILFNKNMQWVGYKSDQAVSPGVTLAQKGAVMQVRIASLNFTKGTLLRVVVAKVRAEPLNASEEAEAAPGVEPGV